MRYNQHVRENDEEELRKKEMAAIEAKRFETEQKKRQAEIELKKVSIQLINTYILYFLCVLCVCMCVC